MSDPVPAITEAAATGEIAAIFADIRRVLGVDVVNLIWRHLATIPGALPWSWRTLRPLYADGTIAGDAAALRGDLLFPDCRRSRPKPLPQRVFSTMTSARSAISFLRTTGPTLWPSSPCPRC